MSGDDLGTIVIGGGQAGLSVGHHLARRGLPYVILDGAARTGDSWRNRWDSLRLFTPAKYSGLDGMPFPAPRFSFPTKDETADYLEAYVRQFELDVRHGTWVKRLSRGNDGLFTVSTERDDLRARNVVVATPSFTNQVIPSFASELDGEILQLNSASYRRPSQLRDGAVLVVGAGNSGAEIAMDLAGTRKVTLAGPDVGFVPVDVDSRAGYLAYHIVRFIQHHVMTTSTPMGRRERQKHLHKADMLIRTTPSQLDEAGVYRVGRIVGVRSGRPVLENGSELDVANVVWCTGFRPDHDWIELDVFDEDGPRHDRGVVADEPGLYFVGLRFLYALSSSTLGGVGRDANHVVAHLAARDASARRAPVPAQ